jgi:cell division protein FtsB
MFGGLAAAGIGYFGWHAHHGEYGLFARERAEARVVELGRELEEVRDERRSLERRVNLLKAESLDPDILEERSREALGLAHPNDVVILRRPDVQRRP